MNDAQIEQEIKDKGLDVSPRVSKDRIDALMARVVYHYDNPEGTTSTLAHAFLDGRFLLATGHSACVSRENFNAELGCKMAREKAEAMARDKLWELEGYVLFVTMTHGGMHITQEHLAALSASLSEGEFVGFTTAVSELMGFAQAALLHAKQGGAQ